MLAKVADIYHEYVHFVSTKHEEDDRSLVIASYDSVR